MNEEIKQQLDRIERYTLLAAKKVLRIEDVALLSGLSKSYVYRLTCEKKIPHYKTSKAVYFDRDEIEAWLKRTPVSTNESQEVEHI